MKSKTIKAVLRKKTDEWIASIKDPVVQELAKKNTIVTGGSIVSMLMREPVNDYDIYFKSPDVAEAIAKYYIEIFKQNSRVLHEGSGMEHPIYVQRTGDRVKVIVKSAGVTREGGTDEYNYFESLPEERTERYLEPVLPPEPDIENNLEQADDVDGDAIDQGEPYRPVFISSNAITLSNKVQLVLRFIGEPEEIHKNYDFVHCTCYWKSWDGELVLPAKALEAIITKELRYVGSLYPLCSIIRLRKFIARGWTINAGQILKMCMQLNALKLTEIAVLEDQLTGVDAFYFLQVLHALRTKQEKDGTVGQPIDGTYLMTIIDRLF